MSMNGEPFIFVSYAHKDSETVYPIVSGLKQKGFNVWYDNGIEAGSEWPEYIAEKILESRTVLVMLSENSLESHNCRREINFAIECKKELLVAYLEEIELTPGMRMQLNSLQAIFKKNFSDDASFLEALANSKILQPNRIFAEQKTFGEERKENENFSAINVDDIVRRIMDNYTSESFHQVNIRQGEERAAEKSPPESAKSSPKEFDVTVAIEEYNRTDKKDDCDKFIPLKNELKDKKIKNAIKFIANGDITEDDVVAFLDKTVLESGKEGFLFTKTCFYFKFVRETAVVKYEELKRATSKGVNTVFEFKDGSEMSVIYSGSQNLCLLLNTIVKHFPSDGLSCVKENKKRTLINEAVKYANKNSGRHGTLEFYKALSEKQKKNITQYIAPCVNDDEIVAFYDSTLSSSGKEGILVTDTELYYSDKSHKNPVAFDDVVGVEENGNHVNFILRNGKTAEKYYSIYSPLVYHFFDYILKNRGY